MTAVVPIHTTEELVDELTFASSPERALEIIGGALKEIRGGQTAQLLQITKINSSLSQLAAELAKLSTRVDGIGENLQELQTASAVHKSAFVGIARQLQDANDRLDGHDDELQRLIPLPEQVASITKLIAGLQKTDQDFAEKQSEKRGMWIVIGALIASIPALLDILGKIWAKITTR